MKKGDGRGDTFSSIRDEQFCRSVSVLLPCVSGNNIPYSCGSDADSNAYFPHEYV